MQAPFPSDQALGAWQGAHVLVLAPTPSHPQDYGNRKRIFAVCHYLKRSGAHLTYLHYPAEIEWRKRVPRSAEAAMIRAWDCYQTIPVTRPLHPVPLASAEDHTIDEWWDHAIGDTLRWIFRVSQFDAFIVNYTWLSKALEFAPASTLKILDTHDRFAGRRELLQANGLSPEFFHTTEAEERIGLERADLIWAIKDQERIEFERVTTKPVHTLLHLDPVLSLPPPSQDPDGYLRVGVIGARNNVNLANFRRFLETATPIFERYFAPVKILVAGSLCDELAGSDPRFVKLLGRVGNTDDFYRAIDIACVPMQFSTGLKIKTGEALSRSVPVVALEHGFEGYVATHPYHRLANFAEMAEAIVEIAFRPSLIPELRTASARSAAAVQASIEDCLTETWRAVEAKMQTILYCIPASHLLAPNVERAAFKSTLEYLSRMGRVTVAISEGPVEALLRSEPPDGPARYVVAAELVPAGGTAAALEDAGYRVAPLAEILESRSSLLVLDSPSELLLGTAANAGTIILRTEMIAQTYDLHGDLESLARFTSRAGRIIVWGYRPSQFLSAVARRLSAELIYCPSCWRSRELHALNLASKPRNTARPVILCSSQAPWSGVLIGALKAMRLLPVLVCETGMSGRPGPGRASPYISGSDYLRQVADGQMALPAFAIDLSFGRLGLQYLRETLIRLGVPVITADQRIYHGSIIDPEERTQVCSLDALFHQVSQAMRDCQSLGPLAARRKAELETDAGWAWLSRYASNVSAGGAADFA